MDNFLQSIMSPYDNYNKEYKEYYFKRDAGLYANLIWVIRKIALLELNGYKVDSLNVILDEYHGEKPFELIFEKKDVDIDYSNITNEEKSFFENNSVFSCFGLGLEDVKNLNFKITNQIINKFFNPNQLLLDQYNNLINSNNINLDKTIFIWARGTDKSYEAKIPNLHNYLNVLNKLDLNDKEILLQTDDYRVLNDFEKSNLKFKKISKIPISKTLNGFPPEIKNFSDEKFLRKYGITKTEYFIQMYCLSLIGRDANKTILYPGNPTTFIPILKGSFENCYLFKDDNQLF